MAEEAKQRQLWRESGLVSVGKACPRCLSNRIRFTVPPGEYPEDWNPQGIICTGECEKCGETNFVKLHPELELPMKNALAMDGSLNDLQIEKVLSIFFPRKK